MSSLIVKGFVIAAGFTSLACVAENKSVPVLDASVYVEGSLCKKPDQIVFSCPLVNSKKIVSMCASGSVAPHRFYYAFGKPQKIEMNYLSNSSSPGGGFMRSFLGYPGGTGGYTYSFVSNNFKYIVYSVSGRYGFNIGGVLVQKIGDIRAVVDMKCAKGGVKDSLSDSLLKETLGWEFDGDINGHALPRVN
ncbi:hypothetical protein [Xanthomonas sp. MUS 060]|uniref:hypothetical protein n=1 Tax=Xanthomonas sp. MUS 060 TaxID=1588031 RepID=UPI000A56D981|nr:hypothetical protein [Xanthomonas sp. MUS 060]